MKSLLLLLFLWFSVLRVFPQCTTAGQTPATAFPVCGTNTFVQQTVPICTNNTVPASTCGSYPDTNPFWYQFTCFVSGSLGLLITPFNLSDDYDWELFDITNHNPNDVYTDPSLFVAGNWSGSYGITGTSASATKTIECGSEPADNVSTFSKMPNLIQGHEYLLLISHYTSTQSGYQLTLNGGTASITAPGIPTIDSAHIDCGHPGLTVYFSKNIRCNSLSADGSQFTISPASGSIVTGATGLGCATGFDMKAVYLTLSAPLPIGGYTVYYKTGSNGNVLVDDCGNGIQVGDNYNFLVKNPVSAQFTYQVFWGCKQDSIQFTNAGGNQINSWNWTLDSNYSSMVQNPLGIYSLFGEKNIQLIVSNGVCNDTSNVVVNLDNAFNASFTGPSNICPTDTVNFKNNSSGNIVSWLWEFGDGTTSNDSIPLPHQFPLTANSEVVYLVKLIVENNLGCFDTAANLVTKVKSCYIAVPNGFTPNGDGINDYLYPLNAYKAIDLDFKVFNRYGQLVFQTRDWTKKWDGTLQGRPQDPGTYVWFLQYTDMDTGKRYFLKGTTVLIR